MANRETANGTFTIDTWDATPYEEQEGATLSRTHLTKTFQGDIVGSSSADLLMAMAQEGSAAYVGFERFNVAIDGKQGTFLLQHNASMTSDSQSATWTIVPNSGTGDLRGLSGEGIIVALPDGGHTFTLEYEFPE